MIDLLARNRRSSTSAPAEPRTAGELVQARLDGRFSRRELIGRAAELGLSAATIGVLLHATSDDAFGAPNPAIGPQRARHQAAPVRVRGRTKPAGTPREGGVVTAGVVGTLDTVNPYTTDLLYGRAFDALSGVMEGLLAFDGKQRLKPALAESFDISNDGLTYSFRLRPNVRFHNGDRFGAEDVVASFELLQNPDLPAGARLAWEWVSRIEAVNSRNIRITTREVYAPFLSYLATGAMSNAVIVPRRYARGSVRPFLKQFDKTPIGTGPMRFVERTGDGIALERFPDYWGKRPRLDGVRVRAAATYEEQIDLLRAGAIQVTADTGSLYEDRVDAALAIDGVTVFEHPSLIWGHLDLKHIGFLRETKVRQALDFATPADRIIDEVLNGRAIRAVADQAPDTWAYNPNIEPRPYSPRRAARLLDEAGIVLNGDGVRARDGEPFAIEVWGEEENAHARRIVELVVEAWRGVGIAAVARFASRSAIWGPMGYQYSDRMTAGYFPWSNFNDPDDLWYWHSSQRPTSPDGAGGNLPAFFFPYNFQDQIDDLTARAAAQPDQEARKELYFEIQELLHEQVPVIFLFWATSHPAAVDRLGGFWPTAFNYLLWNVQDWYLAETE